jgi:hypothetical protein
VSPSSIGPETKTLLIPRVTISAIPSGVSGFIMNDSRASFWASAIEGCASATNRNIRQQLQSLDTFPPHAKTRLSGTLAWNRRSLKRARLLGNVRFPSIADTDCSQAAPSPLTLFVVGRLLMMLGNRGESRRAATGYRHIRILGAQRAYVAALRAGVSGPGTSLLLHVRRRYLRQFARPLCSSAGPGEQAASRGKRSLSRWLLQL